MQVSLFSFCLSLCLYVCLSLCLSAFLPFSGLFFDSLTSEFARHGQEFAISICYVFRSRLVKCLFVCRSYCFSIFLYFFDCSTSEFSRNGLEFTVSSCNALGCRLVTFLFVLSVCLSVSLSALFFLSFFYLSVGCLSTHRSQ